MVTVLFERRLRAKTSIIMVLVKWHTDDPLDYLIAVIKSDGTSIDTLAGFTPSTSNRATEDHDYRCGWDTFIRVECS